MFDLEVYIENSQENEINNTEFFSIQENTMFIESQLDKIIEINNEIKDDIKDNVIEKNEKRIDKDLYGKIKFYKKNNENISLTNPDQNFRYLPINRKNMVNIFLYFYLNSIYYK